MRKWILLAALLGCLAGYGLVDAACITHQFVSAKSDSGDTTIVRPSDWNACHTGGESLVVWDLDLVGALDASTAGHIWNVDPLSTTCTAAVVTGTNRTIGVCTFPDSDGDFGRQIVRHIPTGWTGTLDAEVWWKTTGSGDARFQFQTKCYADDEADDASFNTASVVTAAAGTSGRPNRQAITGITVTGCAADELMRIRFFRNRTEGSDTLTAALDVEKVVFKLKVALP